MATSGTLRANGQDLYFEVHGEGDPLVLIMGIGYDSSLWLLHQVPALARAFKVVIFDNRDAGRSAPASEPYGIADMANDVAGLLDGLSIGRAHVLGLSMGAMIAQEFAVRHGDRLDRMVLSGPDAAPSRRAFHPIQVWNWVKTNDSRGDTFAAQQFSWLFSPSFLRNGAAVRQTAEFLSSNPNPVLPEAYARQAQAYLDYDPMDRMAAVTAPVLVVVGEQDLLTPPWIAREVAATIPGARLEIMTGDGTSHVVALERPDDFNRLVVDFLMESSLPAERGAAVARAGFHMPGAGRTAPRAAQIPQT